MTTQASPGLTRAVGFLRRASACGPAASSAGSSFRWCCSLVWEVVARYCFNAPTVWAYDMTFMLYGTFFMLGSAYTLLRGGHIRTDSLYAQMVAAHAGHRRRRLLRPVLLSAAAGAALRHLGLLLDLVPARRTGRLQPLDARRLPVEIRDAGHLRPAAAAGRWPSCCARSMPREPANGCARPDADAGSGEGRCLRNGSASSRWRSCSAPSSSASRSRSR